MQNEYFLFLQLIQLSIGKRSHFDIKPSNEEWLHLLRMAKSQCLSGICFAGIEKLQRTQSPNEDILMEWMGEVVKIKRRNDVLNKECQDLYLKFNNNGFTTCILKGQSNLSYYPGSLHSRRVPGDIDIWAYPKGKCRNPIKETINLLKKKNTIKTLSYLHAELIPYNGIEIEVHLRPTFLNNPIYSYRLKKWFKNSYSRCIIENKISENMVIPMLKPVYNIIFQLVHIYRHLLDEGIGLRQLLDYYYLLCGTVQSLTDEQKKTITDKLSAFGLNRIAGAVMYVLREVFLIEEEFMIAPVSEIYGRQLLDEIMIAGNFGRYDPRLKDIGQASHDTSYQIRHAIRRFTRNTRFFMAYPSEVFFEPFARVIHFWWRKFKLWNL
ncbi:nucleotidyltransferase family protein [Hallella absiana]|uniref:nucleotidyltransferase family protein n=1 Tax=Hallella absiana TaxID=2925336 RepID=UPI0021C8FF12|nr:nucleotidyltransferase family protein [Hallella absiana]